MISQFAGDIKVGGKTITTIDCEASHFDGLFSGLRSSKCPSNLSSVKPCTETATIHTSFVLVRPLQRTQDELDLKNSISSNRKPARTYKESASEKVTPYSGSTL